MSIQVIVLTCFSAIAPSARAQDISSWLAARKSAYAQWQMAHPAAQPATGRGAEIWDMPETPQLVVVPAGQFVMGSPASEPGKSRFEDPVHPVTIAHAFAIGKFDVTFDEWDVCVATGGCNNYTPPDNGWGRGSRPVVNVSWNDARAYVAWLTAHTGKQYRLPSEAEWEYAARAGTTSAYWWGGVPSHDFANYGKDDCCGGLESGFDHWTYTSPVGSFPANPFGLFDMNGNVLQYVEDCWQPGYAGAPVDGTAREAEHCAMRVLRGGSWSSVPAFIRSADRIWTITQARFNIIGFRVARTL